MEKKLSLPLIILLTGVIASIILGGFYYAAQLNNQNYQEKEDVSQEQEKKNQLTEEQEIVSCTRTMRLDNEPQYDRALSLIQQRVDENNKHWNNAGEQYQDMIFTHFPPELTNCIKVIEDDSLDFLTNDPEAFFPAVGEEIKENYYPIAVSPLYKEHDDIVNALLLAHEIKHVQQYIDELNGEKPLSCIDSEVEAFMAQFDFLETLTDFESESVLHRIEKLKEEKDPTWQSVYSNLYIPLFTIDAMFTINRESGCGFRDLFKNIPEEETCIYKNLRDELREIITNNSYYIKQCGL